MRTVLNAIRMRWPFSAHSTLFVCIIRTLITGSGFNYQPPQKISRKEIPYLSKVYQWQQEKQKLLQRVMQ